MPYTQQIKLAYNAIKKNNLLLTFVQNVDTYSTATQTVIHTSTTYQMWCVITKPIRGTSRGGMLGEGYDEDGSTVDYQQGLLASPYLVPVIPRVGDTLTLGGNKWTIIQKGNTEPDGTNILYKLSIRRG